MKKYSFLFFIIFFLFVSCDKNEENKNLDNKSEKIENSFSELTFKANIEKNNWNAQVSYYEIENNQIQIIAISQNYEKLFITVDETNSGKYELDNRSYFVNNEGTFYVSKGSIDFDFDSEDNISGNFNLDMINSTDSSSMSMSGGKFSKIKPSKILKEENKEFLVSKVTKIDANKGTIEDEQINYEITFKKSVIIFKDLDDVKKSYSIKISKSNVKSTASYYYSSDPLIEYIFVDALKRNVSIFYKNGINKIFYN